MPATRNERLGQSDVLLFTASQVNLLSYGELVLSDSSCLIKDDIGSLLSTLSSVSRLNDDATLSCNATSNN
jgi:hypothetical protein